MICHDKDCDEKAEVGYQTAKTTEDGEEVWEVVGYCEEHDPFPEQEFDVPFNDEGYFN